MKIEFKADEAKLGELRKQYQDRKLVCFPVDETIGDIEVNVDFVFKKPLVNEIAQFDSTMWHINKETGEPEMVKDTFTPRDTFARAMCIFPDPKTVSDVFAEFPMLSSMIIRQFELQLGGTVNIGTGKKV